MRHPGNALPKKVYQYLCEVQNTQLPTLAALHTSVSSKEQEFDHSPDWILGRIAGLQCVIEGMLMDYDCYLGYGEDHSGLFNNYIGMTVPGPRLMPCI